MSLLFFIYFKNTSAALGIAMGGFLVIHETDTKKTPPYNSNLYVAKIIVTCG